MDHWLWLFALIVAVLCLPAQGASYLSHAGKTLLEDYPSRFAPQHVSLLVATKAAANASTANLLRLSRASGCECAMEGYCSCDFILRFMSCIKAVCHSDKCECLENTWQDACESIARQCSNTQLQCSSDKATCDSKVLPLDGELYRQSESKAKRNLEVSRDGQTKQREYDRHGADEARATRAQGPTSDTKSKLFSSRWIFVGLMFVGFVVLGFCIFNAMF